MAVHVDQGGAGPHADDTLTVRWPQPPGRDALHLRHVDDQTGTRRVAAIAVAAGAGRQLDVVLHGRRRCSVGRRSPIRTARSPPRPACTTSCTGGRLPGSPHHRAAASGREANPPMSANPGGRAGAARGVFPALARRAGWDSSTRLRHRRRRGPIPRRPHPAGTSGDPSACHDPGQRACRTSMSADARSADPNVVLSTRRRRSGRRGRSLRPWILLARLAYAFALRILQGLGRSGVPSLSSVAVPLTSPRSARRVDQ